MMSQHVDERYALGLDFEEPTMPATNPDLFNDAIRETCTQANAINRDLLAMSTYMIGSPLHMDLLAARARLDRKRHALYRRQDAAIAAWREENGFDSDGEPLRPADPAVITALHQEQDHYRV